MNGYCKNNCGTKLMDETWCKKCLEHTGEPADVDVEAQASVALDSGDGSTERLIEIPASEYAALRESQRVVEALEGISRHLKDSGDYLFYCHHVAYGWYAFITTHDKGIVNIDEVTFGAVGDTYSAAIRALWEKVKPNEVA